MRAPRRFAATLFPEPATAADPRHWPVWLAVLLGGGLYLAWRTPGVGAWDTVWAEDGANFLNDAANRSVVDAITNTLNGYFGVYNRLVAEVVTTFPVSWWAVVNTLLAVGSTLGLAAIVYQCSAGFLPHRALRLFVAAPVVLQWVANGEAVNNNATLQFPMLYALFWILLAVPRGRFGRIGAPVAAGLIALTTTLAVVFVPLALVRAAVRRDRSGIATAATLVGAIAIQLVALASGKADRGDIGGTRLDLTWIGKSVFERLLPQSFFGERWIAHPVAAVPNHPWLIAAALVPLLAAGVVALLRFRRSPAEGPSIPLAALALLHAVGLYSAELIVLGRVPNRYLVAPSMLIVVAVVALLKPRAGARLAGWAPLAAVGALLAVTSIANYRVDHQTRTPLTPSWSAQVDAGRSGCRADPSAFEAILLSGPRGAPYGQVHIPCDRLR
ncbi:hypothetical protein DFJ67_4836 [Asanoa ferruginea]|uniref:Dolichyl-phosphate-mannose-protein mannosyltransferase n=1 Tax=Asanoa ferruginea TaxID=53367 RepID=A0A3D9ZN76_9ACTN|nr:hypothetical protein DFJ67_4836 [Asanoa ferruginea]GIF49559.1 hypothetical protein Afe04nite_40980 [Asanoa ferruginea]